MAHPKQESADYIPEHDELPELHVVADAVQAEEPEANFELSDGEAARELEIEAVLARFDDRGRGVIDWFLRNPDVRVFPRDVPDSVKGDKRSTAATKRNNFYSAAKQMAGDDILGPYWFNQGPPRKVTYWLDKGWQQSDALPELVKSYVQNPTEISAESPVEGEPDSRVSRSEGRDREIAVMELSGLMKEAPPIDEDTTQSPLWPTWQFERALVEGAAMEAPLSLRGLKIVTFQGEHHIFVRDRVISLPMTSRKILQILSLHPGGLIDEQVVESLSQSEPARQPPPLRVVQNNLELINHQLEGTRTFSRRLIATNLMSRIEGAFPPEF